MNPPRFIQIAISPETEQNFAVIYALGDDGHVYCFVDTNEDNTVGWTKIEAAQPKPDPIS